MDAFNRRDLNAHLALMDDGVEGVPSAARLEGSYHGHDGIRHWWESILDVMPDYRVEVSERARR